MSNKIALAVSGGGYRATLYSLGSLRRLNEFGLLKKLDIVTSVSGGSITTAYIAMKWEELQFDEENGVATNFKVLIETPLRKFCGQSLDVGAGFRGILSFGETIGDKVAKAYDKRLFKGTNIQKLSSSGPDFIFYGTNFQTGASVRLQKEAIRDYKIGKLPNPDISLAKVVGISSAFPPILSPVQLKTDPHMWEETPYSKHFDQVELREKLTLTDGGLYDNLGLEAVWKNSGDVSHLLVCDAGAPFKVKPKIKGNWASQLYRMTDLMTDQQRALRKRKLIQNYENEVYGGTYMGIGTQIGDYDFADSMCSDSNGSNSLKYMRTRLNAFTEKEQNQLINWGYAITDTAVRKWCPDIVESSLNTKGQWPCPNFF
jgi:NTE family protein